MFIKTQETDGIVEINDWEDLSPILRHAYQALPEYILENKNLKYSWGTNSPFKIIKEDITEQEAFNYVVNKLANEDNTRVYCDIEEVKDSIIENIKYSDDIETLSKIDMIL
jgi:hypothetical protein